MWIALFLIFVAVPLLELALLIKLGQLIGFWPTIAIVVATAAFGTAILHHQGFAALRRAAASLNQGKPPVEPVLDGFMLMLAGTLLVAPGLITDCAGLLLLIPPLRKAIADWGLKRMLAAGTIHTTTWRTEERRSTHGPRPSDAGGPVIDGEFERLDEKTQDPRRPDNIAP
jgi:UPF0716 protein FxsA